jgi:hypothetical protein
MSDIVTFYVATAPATPAAPTEVQVYLTNGYSNDNAAI